MKITIKDIPHSKQRYDTVGDWVFKPNGDLDIKVSRVNDRRTMFLVGLHELVEAFLCDEEGITTEDVDHFDMNWTPTGSIEEPGDSPLAPYYIQHLFAMKIEKMAAEQLGIPWEEHKENLNSL